MDLLTMVLGRELEWTLWHWRFHSAGVWRKLALESLFWLWFYAVAMKPILALQSPGARVTLAQ
jgi:hypothetical protein